MSKRIAYVTGGMGGIGTAICQRLHTDGLTVVAGCGPNSPRRERWLAEQAALGFTFIASEGNVGDWESTATAFDRVKNEVGEIDVLVNNAGITRDGVFRKMSKENWNDVIDTNLTSLFNVTKQVIEAMVAKGWGRIINISSVMDRRGSSGRQITRLPRPVFMVSPCHSPKKWRQRASPSIPSRRAISVPIWFALLNPRCWRQLLRVSRCGVWGNPLKLRRLSRGLLVTKPASQRVPTSLLTAACTWDNGAVRPHAQAPVTVLKGFVA